MRLFLYNYAIDGNWEVTCKRQVVGVPHDATGMLTKAERLCVGDIVLIHDNTFDWKDFRVFGACVVDGPLIRQRVDQSPWEDWLWSDELDKHSIICPFRFKVNIQAAPIVNRKQFPWHELDKIPTYGIHGQRIQGKSAWSMKWRGNVIDDPHEVTGLSELFELKFPDK